MLIKKVSSSFFELFVNKFFELLILCTVTVFEVLPIFTEQKLVLGLQHAR